MKLKQLQDTWDRLARKNAFWAVLTSSDTWDPEAFFQTGRQEIADVMKHIDQLSIDLHRHRALDFGCGVGRISQALSEYFDEVHGVDIAPSMIEFANEHNRYGSKCQYYLNADNDLRFFPDNHFDLIYSNIVLQHMMPKYTKDYLVEFLRMLKPGGVLIFQLPSTFIANNPLKRFLHRVIPKYLWNAYRRTKWKLMDWIWRSPQMEMHWIEKEKVIAFLSERGGKVVDARRDVRPTTAHQSTLEHYLYTVTKE